MSLSGKKISNTYKNILNVSNASGTGVSSSVQNIVDGNGGSTPLKLASNKVQIQPSTNQTDMLVCNSSDGSSVLSVDTTNGQVKVGTQQNHATAMTHQFAIVSASGTSGQHRMMYNGGNGIIGGTTPLLGTSADPSTTYDISADTDNDARYSALCYWKLDYAISIDAVEVILSGGSQSTHYHLVSYDVDTSSNFGDLSNGTILANSSADIASPGVDALKFHTLSLTGSATSVTAGKIIIATIENVGGASSVYATMNVKYHLV